MSTNALPASFTSLYRLFLRATSASVLHHKVATANLRRLWRPTFDAAATVTRELQTSEQEPLRIWLNSWEKRSKCDYPIEYVDVNHLISVDTTLALLYTSSQSRGLSHKLTRNLSFLLLGEHQRLVARRPQKAWEPQISKEPPKPLKQTEKLQKRMELEIFTKNAWAPLSRVVKMAEGRDGISLGRVTLAAQSRRRRFK